MVLRNQRLRVDVLPAFVLVMSFLRNSAGGTSRDAFAAFFIPEDQTILFGILISLVTRCQLQEGDNTPHPDGHPFGCDEAIVQAEGPEAAGIGCMALRPRRNPADFLVTKHLERRQAQ